MKESLLLLFKSLQEDRFTGAWRSRLSGGMSGSRGWRRGGHDEPIAVYGRKSVSENVPEDEKSVARRFELVRAFAKSWPVLRVPSAPIRARFRNARGNC